MEKLEKLEEWLLNEIERYKQEEEKDTARKYYPGAQRNCLKWETLEKVLIQIAVIQKQ